MQGHESRRLLTSVPGVGESGGNAVLVATDVDVEAQTKRQTRPRLYFVDYIRVYLTLLVIVHHVLCTYN
eukprot:g15591.t1